MDTPFLSLQPNTDTALPDDSGFGAAGHWWEQTHIDALIAAYAARRPLLVRGEAGSGKSQLARAAAQVLGSLFLCEVIHPRFEALDLLYRFDAVRRLADAQVNGIRNDGAYLQQGALWRALAACQPGQSRPVLLIDEVDKADADLPNSLLDVLGNRSFHVPLTGEVVCPPSGEMPLILITTNEERELPPAFVRRCLVLNLNPPADDTAFLSWLVARGKVHRYLRIADPVRDAAAQQVLKDRKAAIHAGQPKVGLAEYIDLLTALDELTGSLEPEPRAVAQNAWLKRLSDYFLIKGADAPQGQRPS